MGTSTSIHGTSHCGSEERRKKSVVNSVEPMPVARSDQSRKGKWNVSLFNYRSVLDW